MPKLKDDELRAALEARFDSARVEHESLSKQRETALNFYYGRPMGNEIPGRSQVVSKTLMDTIEWLMPSLMRVFTTKQAVQFDPVGPEDEESAKQETAYVDHVLWKQNNGFMLIYNWLKDALLQKVGYVIYWWEVEEKASYQNYTGLTQDQVALVVQELEASADSVDIEESEAGYTAPGVPQTWDIKVKITKKCGRLHIEGAPGDEVFVSPDCRGGVKTAKFAGRLRALSRSDLMSMGFSRAEVDKVTDFRRPDTNVAQARDAFQNETERDDGVDWATREFTLLDAFAEIDADGDGIAETIHVLQHGDGFLINEEVDEVQMCSWTPTPMPHQHVGVDMFDKTEDLQRINTALTRGLLDNTYFGTNQRLVYDKNTINVAMLQINRPGAHIANDGPPLGSVVPIPVSDVATRLLPVIQYTDEVTRRRTGVGWDSGVDADVLAQSTKGAFLEATGKANQLIEATARIFAETGLADLYGSIHKQLLKHQDWQTRFKLRDKWVEVNPTEWQERANLSVSVGLGTAGREETRANLGAMANAQEKAAAVPGLIQPTNVYSLFRRMQVELGFENENFITDPSSPEYQQAMQSAQPPPDPYVEGKKIDAQIETQKLQAQAIENEKDRRQKAAEALAKNEVDLFKTGFQADLGAPGMATELGQEAAPEAPTPQGPDPQVAQALEQLAQQIGQISEAHGQGMQELHQKLEQVSSLAKAPRRRKVIRDGDQRIVATEDEVIN